MNQRWTKEKWKKMQIITSTEDAVKRQKVG